MLYCASAGDSRAVAGLRNGGYLRLSVHHHTSSPEEVARIQSTGAKLEWGKLGGFLPVSRGLGNFDLESEGFTSVPDVRFCPRQEVDFVVIASDGLWDVINDENCCALIRQWGSSASAERLAYYAKDLWEQQMTSPDDIAIVIAQFPFPSHNLSQPLFSTTAANMGA
jgi:protein phosphatase PTC1